MSGPSGPVVIENVRLFDGVGVHPVTNVVLREGVVERVGGDAGAGAERVDGSGSTLLPGLIDAHTHVFPGLLEQALAFGVTTVLDMFGDPVAMARLKEQASTDPALADLRSAGTGATAPGSHPCALAELGAFPPFPTVAGPGEAERFVADRVAEGSDYLKLVIEPGHVLGARTASLDAATVEALVRAARRHRLRTIAHATVRDAAVVALEAGVDGLTHVPMDEPLPPEPVAAAARRGVFAVPTVVVLEAMCGGSAAAALLRDERVEPFLHPMSRMLLQNAAWPPAVEVTVDFAVVRENVRRLHRAGVPILAGTDAASPGSTMGASLHRELELLVAVGLSPVEALTAATAGPARAFGLSDRGRVAPGLRADLLLVRGDPTTDITAVADVAALWRGGRRVDRAALRAAMAGGSVGA